MPLNKKRENTEERKKEGNVVEKTHKESQLNKITGDFRSCGRLP